MSTTRRHTLSADDTRIALAAFQAWHGKPANLTAEEWERAEVLLEGDEMAGVMAEIDEIEKAA